VNYTLPRKNRLKITGKRRRVKKEGEDLTIYTIGSITGAYMTERVPQGLRERLQFATVVIGGGNRTLAPTGETRRYVIGDVEVEAFSGYGDGNGRTFDQVKIGGRTISRGRNINRDPELQKLGIHSVSEGDAK
jgi:hypothetical protein